MTVVAGREGRPSWLTTTAAVHNVDRPMIVLAGISWILAAAAMHVGLPQTIRAQNIAPQPLQSIGALTMCFPASVHAALLGHRAPWLTSTTQGRVRAHLRIGWLAIVSSTGVLAALACGASAPPGVPIGHVVSLWALWFGLAILAAVLLRPELAIVAPVAAGIVATIPALTPFRRNPIYNIDLADQLRFLSAATLAIAAISYIQLGDGSDRAAR